MAGIISFGAYIPLYRLSRELIAKAWGSSGGRGEKAVANWDEDSITMGVEAIADCLQDKERKTVGGLYFATTTPPYQVKQSASIVAGASDLKNEIFTADFSNSFRAGTSALRAALDTVQAGSAAEMLVVAADSPLAAPASEFEPVFGDGAAAFLIGNAAVAVEVEGSLSTSSEFMDFWRLPGERYPKTWEDRFVFREGYIQHVQETVFALLEKYGLTTKDFTKAVFYAPDLRRHNELGRVLGFDPRTQIQDSLFNVLGNTGAAYAPMMLVAALEEAKAGDRILFIGYGDGVDAFILRVTEQIEKVRNRRGIKRHLEAKAMLPTYEKYLRFRNLMEWEAERRPADRSSLTVLWRERKQILRLIGHKCRQCGTVQYPMQRVCTWCQAKDDFEEIRLSDKKGTVFTFSMDERAMIPDLPNVVCILDFDEGGRFYTRVTDRDPEKMQVGMKVELTFRRMHDGSGIHNYYWLARPVRC